MITSNQLHDILSGNAILFIGAGFSVGAKAITGKPIRTGGKLKELFASELNESSPYSLEQLAEIFVEERSESELWELLKSEFTASQVQDYHEQIISLPWKRIYSTNYDNVIELAANNIGKKTATFDQSVKTEKIRSNTTPIIHLHGSVTMGPGKSVNKHIKLTETSFTSEAMQSNPLYIEFRESVDLSPTVIFLGYSLLDVDMQRLLYGLGNLKRKTTFIIGEAPDRLTEMRSRKIGQSLKLNTKAVAEFLIEKFKSFEPLEINENSIGASIERLKIEPRKPATDQSVFNFFLYGRIDDSLFHSSSDGLVKREEADRILQLIENGKKLIVLHSALGNGKSVIIHTLSSLARGAGYKLYNVFNYDSSFSSELEAINNSKSILVIEEYPDWINVLRQIRQLDDLKLALILTSRTVAHEIFYERLNDIFNSSEIVERSCDRISQETLEHFVEIFDKFALWTEETAGASKEVKSKTLGSECNYQIHAILIKALRAPQMRTKMETVLKNLDDDSEIQYLLISLCCFSFIQMSSNLRNIYEILGDRIYSSSIQKNKTVSEFIDFSSGNIFFRSPTTSGFILKEVFTSTQVIAVLIEITESAFKIKSSSDFARGLITKIMRFSFLERMLNNKGRLPAAMRFYEATKAMGTNTQNSHFWLQYAIACTSLGELERAERYFSNAKAIAKRHQDTDSQDKIENHYARYLLECAINGSAGLDYYSMFKNAKVIIEDQIRRRKFDIKLKHYPFKMAKNYADYYDRYSNSLTDKQLREIGLSARFVLNRIIELSADDLKHNNVRDCQHSMQYLLRSLAEKNIEVDLPKEA